MTKFLYSLLLIPSLVWATEFPVLPNPALTTGVVNPTVTKDVLCRKGGYTNGKDAQGNWVRNVPEDKYKQVFVRYNIQWKKGEFEVDHLIPLSLGGTNDINNLWPQSYNTTPYGAHQKDRLEVVLRNKVCSGKLELKVAQDAIRTDWIAAYEKYVTPKGVK